MNYRYVSRRTSETDVTRIESYEDSFNLTFQENTVLTLRQKEEFLSPVSCAISLVLISSVFVKRQKDMSVFTARLKSRRFWFFASIKSQHAHLLNFSLFHVFRQASNFIAEFGTKCHSNGPIKPSQGKESTC